MYALHSKPVILLVEDDPGDQELVRRPMLAIEPDADLRVLANGTDALEYLAHVHDSSPLTRTPMPSLVILDLNLTDMSGLDILDAIRNDEQMNAIPVVILSTSDHPRDIDTSYRLRCNSYLRKPDGYEGYKETVADLRQYWLHRNLPQTH